MLKSSDLVYLKPSYFDNKFCNLGIGKGNLFILLSSSLTSEMKRTVPFLFEL